MFFAAPAAKPKTSEKIRKRLSISSKDFLFLEPFNLNKTTFQKILKKQHCWKNLSQFVPDKQKLLLYGVWRSPLELRPQPRSFSGGHDEESHASQSNRNQKLLLQCKNITRLDVHEFQDLSSRIIKTLGTLINLRSLSLQISLANVSEISQSLGWLDQLRNLSLSVLENQHGKAIEMSLSKTSKFCRSLASRKLESLQLRFYPCFTNNAEVRDEILACLGDSKALYFEITFHVSPEDVIDAEKAEKLLQKVEYLSFRKHTMSYPRIPVNKLLQFKGGIIKNFGEVLSKCSSLENLDFEADAIHNEIPTNPGIAQNITTITVLFSDSKKPFLQFSELLVHIPKLALLAIHIDSRAEILEDLDPIYQSLQNSGVKNYELVFRPSKVKFSQDSQSLQKSSSQISKLQSLEQLLFSPGDIETPMGFEPILANLKNLKELSLMVGNVSGDPTFPTESMAALRSAEKIMINCPKFNKEDNLKKLPELPSIKEISIRTGLWGPPSISIADYKAKYSS